MWCVKIAVLACLAVGAFAQSTTVMPSIDPVTFCGRNNGSDCERCISARQPSPTNPALETVCFYCAANQQCQPFTENTVFPFNGLPCPNLEYNVGTCALTALIIAVLIGLMLLLIVVMITCVCCCCCIWCAQRRKRARMIEDHRYVEEKEGIRNRATDRRQERKAKTDEIRRKYDLP
ncbi:uncharacterized protein LOC135348085 isoform X2 [Halichondria panicea]|uniref:uncharacterized protein LOC135348085 isoform X2 n=1 Tax=Halichondria panicea TaxID=6063 RepID=UPI00312B75DD